MTAEPEHGFGDDLEDHPHSLNDMQKRARTILFWVVVVFVVASALAIFRVI